MDCFAFGSNCRHCEERSDEAIHPATSPRRRSAICHANRASTSSPTADTERSTPASPRTWRSASSSTARAGRPDFTSRYGCNRLVFYERYERMDEAIAREKQIKGGVAREEDRADRGDEPGLEGSLPESPPRAGDGLLRLRLAMTVFVSLTSSLRGAVGRRKTPVLRRATANTQPRLTHGYHQDCGSSVFERKGRMRLLRVPLI